MQEHSIRRFIGIPDHKPSDVYFLDENGQPTQDDEQVKEVVIELSRVDRNFRCPCGRSFITYYDVKDRFVRDLPWGPWKKVWLLVPRFRVDCPTCGVTTEQLDWIAPRPAAHETAGRRRSLGVQGRTQRAGCSRAVRPGVGPGQEHR